MYNLISSRGEGVVKMSNKKRRRRKPTARPERMKQLAADILAGTVSGLITAAILKLLDW
jgi:hypothetical protein